MGQKLITGGPSRYAHQRRGLRKMIETRGRCALLFDPGTGKTATTLDFISLLALKAPQDEFGVQEARVLVVAPLAAIDTWVSQAGTYLSPQINFWAEALRGKVKERGEALAARNGQPLRSSRGDAKRQRVREKALHVKKSVAWDARGDFPIQPAEGPDALGNGKPRAVIEVLNTDTFGTRQPYGSGTMADFILNAVERFDPHLVVVDESHKIKSATSNASRLLGRIAERVPRRVALTGTVMPAGPMDVFGQWRFVEPYAFGQPRPDGTRSKATFSNFKARYARMGGYMGKEIVGYHRLDEMQEIMSRNSIVARKEEALDLPTTTDIEVKVTLTPREAKAYKDMKKSLAAVMGTGEMSSAPNRLAQMMRLRQITSGHLPTDDGQVQDLGHSKADAIASLVHDTLVGESRLVIFCLFRNELEALTERMRRDGTEVLVISGDTPASERTAIRKRFGSDDPARLVLIAQIKTLSLAVNELVTASHAIFASLSQQRDDYIQARDRLNRIGQTRPVTFWHAVVPGTVDPVILQAHRDRTDLESAVLKHILESNDGGA